MVSGNSIEITGTTPLPTFGNSCSEYSLIVGDFSGRNTDTKWFAGSFVEKNLKGSLSSNLLYSLQPSESPQKVFWFGVFFFVFPALACQCVKSTLKNN